MFYVYDLTCNKFIDKRVTSLLTSLFSSDETLLVTMSNDLQPAIRKPVSMFLTINS